MLTKQISNTLGNIPLSHGGGILILQQAVDLLMFFHDTLGTSWLLGPFRLALALTFLLWRIFLRLLL